MTKENSFFLNPLITLTNDGLFCSQANVYIDPWRPVEHAITTHAHADHARPGNLHYYTSNEGLELLKQRLNLDSKSVTGFPYGEPFEKSGVRISFHSAGHIRGSAQIKLDNGDQVWVISGDYKRQSDPTCSDFQNTECDVFVTESTFALPVYRWPSMDQVIPELLNWWNSNIKQGRTSILLCYSLGKAQRIMSEIQNYSDRTVLVHKTISLLTKIYEADGVSFCDWRPIENSKKTLTDELVIAPPSVGIEFLRQFVNPEIAMASGWMQIRGMRKQNKISQGFVVSDHADWNGLVQTIEASKARLVLATHGKSSILNRYLENEKKIKSESLSSFFYNQRQDNR